MIIFSRNRMVFGRGQVQVSWDRGFCPRSRHDVEDQDPSLHDCFAYSQLHLQPQEPHSSAILQKGSLIEIVILFVCSSRDPLK